ncbi:hypothetical protein KCP91_15065 [Microvirga sp. SRT01]|jgi:hypothetical protein|uniref:DUF6894 domain-containing protein n=1 Tax=Sphingomonas longa TaxID=2778730 RepID=A0ABS2D9U3_9SPHN|nr:MULTISPECIES: hypothetical protein [Alphaproteobacteria]MBM6577702.1 hypothetical protein [Sphingomonas sp. BT552]MBR7710744.1 hypothetical protein [Microvirga sp. SRT01]
MPRYFFHVRDGTMAPDWNGLELANLGDARLVANRFAGDLLKELKQFPESGNWSLVVTDGQGLNLFTLLVASIDAAVLPPPSDPRRHNESGSTE